MFTQTILAAIDNSMASAAPVVSRRPLGRRFLIGGAASGVAMLGFSCFSEPSQGRPATIPMAAPARAKVAPTPPAPPAIPRFDYLRVAPTPAESRDWLAFRAHFITSDGRVTDSFNNGVSHTESQGTGMLMAVANNDRATFERIWNWTASHLGRQSDALHAWRYEPGAANPVADTNNATDGDIYIAGALVRAASLWGSVDYLRAGQAIARDILGLLVREVGGRVVLLPGAVGFVAVDRVEINLSYYIFPLLVELKAAYPSPLWDRLLSDGRRLVDEARFGRWQLPPDWLYVSTGNGAIAIAQRLPPRFSFDAVRIALFLAWDRGQIGELDRFASFWGQNPAASPAWVDLKTNQCAPYKACGGVIAIAKLADRPGHGDSQDILPPIQAKDDYYSAALILLSRLAMREAGTRTV